MPRPWLTALILLSSASMIREAPAFEDRPDRVVADFEGETYRPWVAEGNAFGTGPARGALPGQMTVGGFVGNGLVNSFLGGDDSTGTLTSPPFRIERPFLNFLIGGGKFPGETCLDLLVGGSVVRTATGPNDRPGGSEQLDWASWEVSDLIGKEAVLRVVDHRKGGWGHVSVDQIVQSDRPRGVAPASREMVVHSRYLHLPVDEKAPMRRVKLAVDGATIRDFDIKLAEEKADFLAFVDLTPFAGKALKIETRLPVESEALGRITQANEVPDAEKLYREKDRPQFHFTSRRGWLNDPNGLVWLDGEYHLFYQHNPYGWDWGNMHWGHAVSPDLIRWTELPIALYPRAHGDWAFSGSAVIDRENTSGFGPEGSSPMVGAFTSTGRGECIIYSLDRGRTWSEFPGNPVVKHQGRDPRLLWHEPTSRWIMAIYDEEGGRRDIVFHSSPDLKTWTYESKIEGFFECPDFVQLEVEGEPGSPLWALYAADGEYLLGGFDGHRFNPEADSKKHRTRFGNFYAAQTFSNEPEGRTVQIGWGQGITFPGMPFNQQMTVPCELTLRPTDEGVRMFANPVDELETLRIHSKTWSDLKPEDRPFDGLKSDLLDLTIEAEVGTSGSVTLDVPGAPVVYDAAKQVLSCGNVTAPLKGRGGSIRLRVLVDRGSVEVFGEDGRVTISKGRGSHEKGESPALRTSEGAKVRSLEVNELGSSWARVSDR
ncbi:GH32 C-terminal domain-containing protein [Tundrisphaera lichenicola]|uniref:GH32 C-terminal domain-containing protein n=1 Tax=Tundrisphaera lichenicola TaxID=2029860 RepID=UPI003EB79619